MRNPRPDAPTGDAARVTGMGGPVRATASRARWSGSTLELDVFWPILAVILVAAVVFVASVANNSMDQVGPPLTPRLVVAEPTTPSPTSTSGTILIVQISSHPTKAEAQTAVDELASTGFEPQILKSDDFQPLNRGFWVVYTGPYPTTANGRAQAKHDQEQLPGALLREVRRR